MNSRHQNIPRRLIVAAAALTVATTSLTGCVPSPSTPASDTGAPASTSPSGATVPNTAATPTSTPPAPAPQDAPPQVRPDQLPKAQQDAAQVAVNTMAIFGRKDLPYEQWWALLAPNLTSAGQFAFEYTEPANVPVHQVTGDPSALEENWTTNGAIAVPTDAGTYQVLLSRPTADSGWLVWDIVPPGRQQKP